MLTELKVHNFRTLINATFRFKRRHLLIGKNNSGKTNLCLALTFPRLAVQGSLLDAVSANPGGLWDFCNYAVRDKDRVSTFQLTCEIETQDKPLRYRYELGIRTDDPARTISPTPACSVATEVLTVSGEGFHDTDLIVNDGKNVKLLHEERFREKAPEPYVQTRSPTDSTMLAKLYEQSTNPTAIRFRDSLREVMYFNFSANRIRYGWQDAQSTRGLYSFGDNLAQMIYMLKTRQESRYRRILERVRRIEPRLVAINHLTGPDQAIVPMVELEGGRTASWASLSDGTLRALALSYLVEFASIRAHEAGQPASVFVVEEPENSLYVGELQSLFEDMDNTAGSAQFIFTTHSPYTIDLFDVNLDAVTLLKREKWHTTGETLGERRAEIEAALKTMSLGEQYFREMLG
jgi:predicted ATPase